MTQCDICEQKGHSYRVVEGNKSVRRNNPLNVVGVADCTVVYCEECGETQPDVIQKIYETRLFRKQQQAALDRHIRTVAG